MATKKGGALVDKRFDGVEEDAAKLIKEIKEHPSSWDDAYRAALAKNLFCKFVHDAALEDVLCQLVAERINAEFRFEGDDELSIEWYQEEDEKRRNELIFAQDACCNEIEQSKESLEQATERSKAAKAAIDEGNSRLRFLARELKRPFVSPLAPAPSRQRELPIGDGEEWRAVPLAEVLAGDMALKAAVLEKLGNINLGKYAEEAQKSGVGDKPKKLTRKQWDRVEALVQEWHAKQNDFSREDDEECDEE